MRAKVYTRKTKSFVAPKARVPDTLERIYKTYLPTKDGEDVFWKIKTPAQSHLSTIIYIERSYFIRVEQVRFADDDEDEQIDPKRRNVHIGHGALELNQPGFSIQSMMTDIHFSFNGGTVSEKPSKIVPWLQQLYPESFKSYIRGSGRAFADTRVRMDRTFFSQGLSSRILRRFEADGVWITLMEPMIVSFCKPGRQSSMDRGDIVPNVSQFDISMAFKDEAVKLLNLAEVYADDVGDAIFRQTQIDKVETKLHVTHFRGEISEMKAPIEDTVIRTIGQPLWAFGGASEMEKNRIRV